MADDMYEAIFQWPHANASNVILTGTFDQWSKSVPLTRGPTGFQAKVRIPWGTKVAYKFIVDGVWATIDGLPAELDPMGNWNNVYTTPPQPLILTPTPTPTQTEPKGPDPASEVLPATTTHPDAAEAPEALHSPTSPTAPPITVEPPSPTTQSPASHANAALPSLDAIVAQTPQPASEEHHDPPSTTNIGNSVESTINEPSIAPAPTPTPAPTATTTDTEPSTDTNTATAGHPEVLSQPPQHPNGTPSAPMKPEVAAVNGSSAPKTDPLATPPASLGRSTASRPSSSTSPPNSSPTSSRFSTVGSRKKKESILVRIKHMFIHEDDGEKKHHRRSSLAK